MRYRDVILRQLLQRQDYDRIASLTKALPRLVCKVPNGRAKGGQNRRRSPPRDLIGRRRSRLSPTGRSKI
jgi:hypothetical protein